MIREMTVHDIQDIRYIALTSYCHLFQDKVPQDALEIFIDRSYSDLMLTEQMERTTVLLATDQQGVPVGFLSHTPIDEDQECEVTALHVLPSHQYEGHERMLLETALDLLQDARQIDVYVDDSACELQAFYEDQGFHPVESFPELFVGIQVETIHYSLPVRQPVYA